MKDADVDLHRTNQWLTSGGLKAETEGLITAAQDQSLATRLYHSNIIKDGTNPLCRMCGKFDESVNHVISGCPELAKTEYIERHDNGASYTSRQLTNGTNKQRFCGICQFILTGK